MDIVHIFESTSETKAIRLTLKTEQDMKKTLPRQPVTKEVIALTKAEHSALKKKLSPWGALQKMMDATGLASQTIRNLRDKGQAEKTTVQKMREYMAEAVAV